MSEEGDKDLEFEFQSAGEKLLAARKAKKMSLADISAKTRITQRHLEAIERGEYDELPGRTYAIGFSKSYAQVVGLPEHEVVEATRRELDELSGTMDRRNGVQFELDEPSKVPPPALAWIAAAVALALLIAGFGVWRSYFFPGAPDAALENSADYVEAPRISSDIPPAADAATNTAAGPVVFTATIDDVWVKFYDGDGRQLFQDRMSKGDSFTVPADAEDPQIWTGRPDGFTITVGGKAVPPLGTAESAIKDVPISAEALLARSESAATTAESNEAPVARPAANVSRSAGEGVAPIAASPRASSTKPSSPTDTARASSAPPTGGQTTDRLSTGTPSTTTQSSAAQPRSSRSGASGTADSAPARSVLAPPPATETAGQPSDAETATPDGGELVPGN